MNTISSYHITLQIPLLLTNVGWEFDFDNNHWFHFLQHCMIRKFSIPNYSKVIGDLLVFMKELKKIQ